MPLGETLHGERPDFDDPFTTLEACRRRHAPA